MTQRDGNTAPIKPTAWRAASLLTIEGATAAEFLQGYLTCDTQRITGDTATPMAICNVQGRVLASGWAFAMEEAIGLIVHKSVAAEVEQFLKPYVTFSKCKLSPHGTRGLTISDQPPGTMLIDSIFASPCDDVADDKSDASARVTNALVEAGFAFVSAAVSARYLPQMLGLDGQGAVDFDKGCYLGQEIVARAQFRGAVKRKLTRFAWHDTQPEIGSTWQESGTVIDVSDDGHGLAITKG